MMMSIFGETTLQARVNRGPRRMPERSTDCRAFLSDGAAAQRAHQLAGYRLRFFRQTGLEQSKPGHGAVGAHTPGKPEAVCYDIRITTLPTCLSASSQAPAAALSSSGKERSMM